MLRIEIDDIKKLDKLSLINLINFLTAFIDPVRNVQQDTPIIPLDLPPEIEPDTTDDLTSVTKSEVNTFPEIMNKITQHIRDRQLTAANVLEIIRKFGLENTPDLATRTDLIPTIAFEINKRIWGEK